MEFVRDLTGRAAPVDEPRPAGEPRAGQPRAPFRARRVWQPLVLGRLLVLSGGRLRISGAGGLDVTAGDAADDAGDLAVHIRVHRDRAWRRVALGGTQGVWESYLDADWDADDLTALARLFSRNRANLYALDSGVARLVRPAARAAAWFDRNTRAGARRNIAAHYDLGNEFFALMLDPTMTYSSGVFERAGATLEEASVAKIERLLDRLAVTAGDHLLEIGTGWGGLAIHAARTRGCRVTTTTLSREQHAFASARVAEAGVADRVTLLRRDYRDLDGQFTKIVSVEMIEAVGAEFLPAFFRACAARLVPGGVMALQAITVADQQFDTARRDGTDFIKRMVFPGSCIPSIAALLVAARDASDFRLTHLEDLTDHYPPTLAAWRANLDRHDDAVRALTTERFRRLWRLYLAYCEGGFLERHIGLVHMRFVRPGGRT